MAETRPKDGVEWLIGRAKDVAWIEDATVFGYTIDAAIPPVFEAYCTIVLPEHLPGAQGSHDRSVMAVLERHTDPQPWWLGYLEYGTGYEFVFNDAPRTQLYAGWSYIVARAGPDQVLRWRPSEGHLVVKGALPELMFPADRSWLLSTLWDDEWTCIGGSEELIAAFLDDPVLGGQTRRVALGEDATPPGHTAI